MIRQTYFSGRQRFLLLVVALLVISLTSFVWAQGNVRHQMLLEEAKTGDAEAQYRLGLSYASGFGVDENPVEAEKWYRMAAEQGLAIAQKNLAELLAGGRGVTRNYIEAYKWYEISIPGLPDSLESSLLKVERDALVKKMTVGDRSKAKTMAADWVANYRARTGQAASPAGVAGGATSESGAEQPWTCDKTPVRGPTPKLWLNPCLLSLAVGKWTMIDRQKRGDAVRFRLQSHGGSAFDTRRGRIILFGSDTHTALFRRELLINSPLLFDVAKLRWMRLYPPDPPETYTVNQWGMPVAGYAKDHPWAMHTYGAVEYDPRRDEMIVSSRPEHLVPGRFTNMVAHLWERIRHHPTWLFSFKTNRWSVMAAKPESFFRFATAFDSNRGVVIGYREDGVYELGGRPRKWRQIARKGFRGGHSNMVYDSKHKAVVVFGGGYDTGDTNDVVAFWPETRRHRIMPTAGVRPRADTHVPMAYHAKLERTVVVVDEDAYLLTNRIRHHSSAQTWLYDLGKDRWTNVEPARMPLGLGMNYNMVYDPGHDVLLLVAEGQKGQTEVWALRL